MTENRGKILWMIKKPESKIVNAALSPTAGKSSRFLAENLKFRVISASNSPFSVLTIYLSLCSEITLPMSNSLNLFSILNFSNLELYPKSYHFISASFMNVTFLYYAQRSEQ